MITELEIDVRKIGVGQAEAPDLGAKLVLGSPDEVVVDYLEEQLIWKQYLDLGKNIESDESPDEILAAWKDSIEEKLRDTFFDLIREHGQRKLIASRLRHQKDDSQVGRLLAIETELQDPKNILTMQFGLLKNEVLSVAIFLPVAMRNHRSSDKFIDWNTVRQQMMAYVRTTIKQFNAEALYRDDTGPWILTKFKRDITDPAERAQREMENKAGILVYQYGPVGGFPKIKPLEEEQTESADW